MARTKEERDALRAELEAEEEAEAKAAAAGGGRSENLEVVIDLSDEAAVNRGLELGFLKRSDLDGGEGGEAGEGGEVEGGEGGKGKGKEKAPRRAGYFDKGGEGA